MVCSITFVRPKSASLAANRCEYCKSKSLTALALSVVSLATDLLYNSLRWLRNPSIWLDWPSFPYKLSTADSVATHVPWCIFCASLDGFISLTGATLFPVIKALATNSQSDSKKRADTQQWYLFKYGWLDIAHSNYFTAWRNCDIFATVNLQHPNFPSKESYIRFPWTIIDAFLTSIRHPLFVIKAGPNTPSIQMSDSQMLVLQTSD